MPVKPLFRLNRRSFGIRAVVFLSALPAIGELCAGRARDVVKDCGLEAAPEPGHCCGLETKVRIHLGGGYLGATAECPSRVGG